MTAVAERFDEVRAYRERPIKTGKGFVQAFQIPEGTAAITPEGSVLRIDFSRFIEQGKCSRRILLLQLYGAQIVERFSIVRISLQNLSVNSSRSSKFAFLV